MAMARKSCFLRTILSLTTICLFHFPVSAQDNVSTDTYVFITKKSIVVKTGGIAGVHETYPIQGQFQLKVNFDGAVALFGNVDALLLSPISSSEPQGLGELFNMRKLKGTVVVVDDLSVEFRGKTADDTDTEITLKLTFTDNGVQLTGRTIPPSGSADFFIFNLDAFAQKKYSGGTGELNNPYKIATAEDLMLLGDCPEDYDRHFILTADIDFDPNLPGGKVFDKAVIAPDTNDVESGYQGTPFSGTFDGNGYVINNLLIQGVEHVGLFGRLDSAATISNLGLKAIEVKGTTVYIGSLAGSNGDGKDTGGSLINCHSTGAVSGGARIGGLVGINWGSITTSYFTGTVRGTNGIGGLVGSNWGSITASHSRCTVGGGEYVGGFAGFNFCAIAACYSTGTVSGTIDVGGLVGFNTGSVFASYSTSSTSGEERVGGLVGVNKDGSAGIIGTLRPSEGEVTNCYSTGTVSGYSSVGGLVGSNGYVIHIPTSQGITPEIPIPEIPIPIIPIPTVPIRNYEEGRISNCYSTGKVFGSYSVGGLVGNNGGGHGITNASFWDIDTSGQIGSCGGTDKTTAEMQSVSTFLEVGWDFMDETENGTEDIWWIVEGQDYPRLWWERSIDDTLVLVVDDFESYNDLDLDDPNSNRIYLTWIDGWDIPINGCLVDILANLDPCWGLGWALQDCENIPIPRSGEQSMAFFYDNTTAEYSEATKTLVSSRDWTQDGIGILSLWFNGDTSNAAEQMCVSLANTNGMTSTVYHDNPDAALIEDWTEWTVDLTKFSDQSVDLTDVDTISIGFGDKDNSRPGGEGQVFFDDIRLYRPPWSYCPVPVELKLPRNWPWPVPVKLPPTWPVPVEPVLPPIWPVPEEPILQPILPWPVTNEPELPPFWPYPTYPELEL